MFSLVLGTASARQSLLRGWATILYHWLDPTIKALKVVVSKAIRGLIVAGHQYRRT